MSPRTRRATPEETRQIAAHALQHQACRDCGAAPGDPCPQPGKGRTVCRSRFIAAAIDIRQQGKAARTAAHAEALARLPRVPREEIEACRTPAGGYSFTRERLAAWGVPWPPPPGWRAALERGEDNNPGKTTP